MNIKHDIDVENATVDPSKGYGIDNNPGIQPGATEPKGENAVNTQSPHVDTKKYPQQRGSGY